MLTHFCVGRLGSCSKLSAKGLVIGVHAGGKAGRAPDHERNDPCTERKTGINDKKLLYEKASFGSGLDCHFRFIPGLQRQCAGLAPGALQTLLQGAAQGRKSLPSRLLPGRPGGLPLRQGLPAALLQRQGILSSSLPPPVLPQGLLRAAPSLCWRWGIYQHTFTTASTLTATSAIALI